VPENRKVLVIDDMESIRLDFAKILGEPTPPAGLAELEQSLFGTPERGAVAPPVKFELGFASQGLEGLAQAADAAARARPFAMAFVDVRMPPGLDGIETIARLWELDPRLEIVICTAYSDYTWHQMLERLSRPGQFLVLGKPFDSTAVRQMALALTEKWNLARAAEWTRAELDRLVQEQTRALSEANAALKTEMQERLVLEKRLTHAQKLEALGRLVAGVAHEINNPLSFVLANLDHVAKELVDQEDEWGGRARELREAAEEAHVGGRRIRQIVQDLTSFSRPDHPAPETVVLEEVMQFALRMARPAFPAEVRVRTAFAEIPPLRASSGELSQVFLNLLVNAGHAIQGLAPERQVISVEIGPAAEGRVLVAVRDTGVGIPEALLASVFDPFFTTQPQGEGTGLGLSICHGIIQRLGGEISIESKEGIGTSVLVDLPAAEEGALDRPLGSPPPR
jgi:signal transduction histidine kinase